MSRKKLLFGLPVAFAVVIALSACSSGTGSTTTEETTAPPAAEESMTPEAETMDPAANLVAPAAPDTPRLSRTAPVRLPEWPWTRWPPPPRTTRS